MLLLVLSYGVVGVWGDFYGYMCVPSCNCCVVLSVVHPVSIMIAVFCIICSLLMLVSDAGDDHIVYTYSIMGLVMALYVRSIVSFVFTMLLM